MSSEPSMEEYLRGKTGENNWEGIDTYYTVWEKRIYCLYMMVTSNIKCDIMSIMDIGAGPEWLRKFIPKGCAYVPVDLKKHTERTYVCDINKETLPNDKFDLIFISGCLEYVENMQYFLHSVKNQCSYIVCSYCSLDIHSDREQRRKLAWVNDFTDSELIEIFEKNGFTLLDVSEKMSNRLFLFMNTEHKMGKRHVNK